MYNKINVAVVGVGNLINALVQGIEYYKDPEQQNKLLFPKIGGFTISDINVVAAFDIDARKVGKDLAEAIFAYPNKMPKVVDLQPTGVIVQKAPVLDGLAETTAVEIEIANVADADIAKELKEKNAHLIIIATPTGTDLVVETFVKAALEVGIGVINATPSPIARNPEWAKKFVNAQLPIIGDDLQSRAGGTVFHKELLNILQNIEVNVKDTYQLDVSGGLEGLTTLDFDRRQYKRKIKEESISRSLDHTMNVASGSTDYLEFLGSTRVANYWVKGTGFLDQPVTMDIRMSSVDGSNGASALVDAIRAMKIALNRVLAGPISSPCAFLFKAPPLILPHDEAKNMFLDFISGYRKS